jgi:hypothetical protein
MLVIFGTDFYCEARMKYISIATLMVAVCSSCFAQVHDSQRQGTNMVSCSFDLLTTSSTGETGYSDYIQIRADGSVIRITSNPDLHPGSDVSAGHISEEAIQILDQALGKIFSPEVKDKGRSACPVVIPDAPSSEITMIKDGQKHQWANTFCPTAHSWQVLNQTIRMTVAGALKPVR